jgi:hypothetical protein
MPSDRDELNEAALRVLQLFGEMESDTLDLHTIFELAGGNDPAEREAVFDAVEALVARNMLAERGNDYYALTELGARVTTLRDEARLVEPEPEARFPVGRLSFYLAALTMVVFILIAIQCS